MTTEYEEFLAYTKKGFTNIPVIRTFLFNDENIIDIYWRLTNNLPQSFILETLLQNSSNTEDTATIIGFDCQKMISCQGFDDGYENKVTVNNKIIEQNNQNPLDFLSEYIKNWQQPEQLELPNVFLGGLVGYFGFETICFIEKKIKKNQ